MLVHLKCPRCGAKMSEDEFYWENKQKKVELGCYLCPKKIYVSFEKYRRFLEQTLASRGIVASYK